MEKPKKPKKPKGSGYFATIWGGFFLCAFVASFFTDLTAISPDLLLRAWLVFAGGILMIWGIVRINTGNTKDYRIGQSTINFVVAIVGTTIALLALVKQ